MPSPFLLVDFGATHVKAALYDPERPILGPRRIYSSPAAMAGEPGRCELSLAAFHALFDKICRDFEADQPLSGILLCSQMHGFAVLSNNNQPLTPYISWKDERSLEPISGISTFEKAAVELSDTYQEITGMRARPGFPFFNIVHLARQGRLPKEFQVITLPDWLARVSDKSNRVSHETMLAGLGLWDLRQGKLSERLLAFCKDWTGRRYSVQAPTEVGSISGFWRGKGRAVPIYAGVGDHPCAVLGANCPLETSVSINIATGSQVARIRNNGPQSGVELRPYFHGLRLHTITHIPAGRALEIYLGRLADAAGMTGDLSPYWKLLDELTFEEIDHTPQEIDLALFQSAWNYREGGQIRQTPDAGLDLQSFLASLARSLARQYLEALKVIDADQSAQELVLSGGIARKMRALPRLLREWTGRRVRPAAGRDETLLGLQRIALQIVTGEPLETVSSAKVVKIGQ